MYPYVTFKCKTSLFICLFFPQNFPQNQRCLFLFSQIRYLPGIFNSFLLLSSVLLASQTLSTHLAHCSFQKKNSFLIILTVPTWLVLSPTCITPSIIHFRSLLTKPCVGHMNFVGSCLWCYLPCAQKPLGWLLVSVPVNPKLAWL